MTLDPRAVARTLGGSVSGCNVLAPGPGHSRADRSLSIKIDPAAPDSFIVHSFAGDSPITCRDHVRAALGLGARERRRQQSSRQWSGPCTVAPGDNAANRSAFALRLWNEARHPGGTMVAGYLASRGLPLADNIAGEVIRFHSALKFKGAQVGATLALFRDIRTNEPCGIHRTFLDGAGRKLDRKMLGRARDAAIKLDAEENVTLGLHVGEGVPASPHGSPASAPCGRSARQAPSRRSRCCPGSRRSRSLARWATAARTTVRPIYVRLDGSRRGEKHSLPSRLWVATLTTYGARSRHDSRISATGCSARR